MQQQSTNAMSTYELVATIIALIALIQPWVIKLWKTLFKRVKIAFIPSGKIKLFYNRSGAYVRVDGVIEAKNQSTIIRDISAKVIRLSDKAELKMDWSSFNTPVYQNIAGNIVILEHVTDLDFNDFEIIKQKKYGDKYITFLQNIKYCK